MAQVNETWRSRLQSRARWLKSGKETILWFLYGAAATTLISVVTPGRPILVGSNSIQTGLYWLDDTVHSFGRGDVVSFPFTPTQPWLQARYTDTLGGVFTKQVGAIGKDTIQASADGSLLACPAPNPEITLPCRPVGKPQSVDSQGRQMTPWLQPGQHYTLKANEIWVFGLNPKSLDSRYFGPIDKTSIQGRADIIFKW